MTSPLLIALFAACMLAIAYCVWRYIDPSELAVTRRARRKGRYR